VTEENDISLDAALGLIADVVGPAGEGFWALSEVLERNVNGPGTVTAKLVVRTPDGRLRDVHGVVGGPADRAGCEARLVEALRADGWPLRPSEEETRLRLEVMGPNEALAILKRYREDLDQAARGMEEAGPDPSEAEYRASHPRRCCMSWY
jgi:hypothetical protein